VQPIRDLPNEVDKTMVLTPWTTHFDRPGTVFGRFQQFRRGNNCFLRGFLLKIPLFEI
jgi:hypothetical protein